MTSPIVQFLLEIQHNPRIVQSISPGNYSTDEVMRCAKMMGYTFTRDELVYSPHWGNFCREMYMRNKHEFGNIVPE
eukprot:g27287.t1